MFAKSLTVAAAMLMTMPANAWVETSRARYTFEELRMFHRQHLKNLRSEVLAQQQVDGGKLSRTSMTRFQHRLDEINRQYRITLRRNDPFSVDGLGHPIARNYAL